MIHIINSPRAAKYGLNQNEEFLELIKQELELLNSGKSLEELDMYECKRLEEKLNNENESFDLNEFYVEEKAIYAWHISNPPVVVIQGKPETHRS